MLAITSTQADLNETESHYQSVTSELWLKSSEQAAGLTEKERRAVELYVRQHCILPWYTSKIRRGGLEHCLGIVKGGPNRYGLA